MRYLLVIILLIFIGCSASSQLSKGDEQKAPKKFTQFTFKEECK